MHLPFLHSLYYFFNSKNSKFINWSRCFHSMSMHKLSLKCYPKRFPNQHLSSHEPMNSSIDIRKSRWDLAKYEITKWICVWLHRIKYEATLFYYLNVAEWKAFGNYENNENYGNPKLGRSHEALLSFPRDVYFSKTRSKIFTFF